MSTRQRLDNIYVADIWPSIYIVLSFFPFWSNLPLDAGRLIRQPRDVEERIGTKI